jgi:glycosyltransferase involved in cell wall biosynthesis
LTVRDNFPVFVLAVLALPPPTHGQALVNESVVKKLAQAPVRLKVVNTSPGTLKKGVAYHLRRIRKNIIGILFLITAIYRRRKTVYTIVEPGYGIMYNFILISFARLAKYQIILHHHSALYTKAFSIAFWFLTIISGRTTLHVALDDRMRADLKKRYGLRRVTVAHNACHIPDSGLPNRRCERPLTCGFLSNLSLEKGLDTFFDTMRVIRNSGLDVRMLLAGPIADPYSKELIENAKIEFDGILTVLGPVTDQRKDLFFRSIDLFLFPSRYRYEAQPLVIIEAMSYGIPIIATDQGYSKRLIGGAGVCANGDTYVESAQSFIAKCVRDASFYQSVAAQARQIFERDQLTSQNALDALIKSICGVAATNRDMIGRASS